jgi:hypothetical protein
MFALAAIHFGRKPSGVSAGSSASSALESPASREPPPATPSEAPARTAVAPEKPPPKDSAVVEPALVAPPPTSSKEKGKTKKTEVRRGPVETPPSGSVPVPSALPAAKRPDCEPNFVLDSDGEKHFKPECF